VTAPNVRFGSKADIGVTIFPHQLRSPWRDLFRALEGRIVGVSIVGRPVSRRRDDGVTAEVTRLYVSENQEEAIAGLEIIKARRAHFLLSDGGLDRARWQVVSQ
jgi:hypothetical protein